jgi:large subunit ribosomal protein L25
MEGGRVQHSMVEIEVSCLPKDLPEYIEVNMEDAALGTIIHISDIKLPKGVESVALSHGEDHDLPVASIVAPKGGDELDDASVEAAGDEAATEGGEE